VKKLNQMFKCAWWCNLDFPGWGKIIYSCWDTLGRNLNLWG